MKDISISPEWKAAAETVSRDTGIFMIMGVPDSGKSTLSRYLIHYLTNANRIVAMIDCDVGQTHLGPPTTIGMMLYSKPTDQLDTIKPQYMRFIGTTSPIGHLLEIVVGTRNMADKALSSGAEVVIVNTSGLILGFAGTRLKLNQVDLLRPKYILALQQASEIEHLLTSLETRQCTSIISLPVSKHARRRSPEVRRCFREKRYREYFRGSQMVRIPISQVVLEGNIWTQETSVNIDGLESLLLGLCDSENYVLALGILKKFDLQERALEIITPLDPKDSARVRTVRLGRIKVHADGQEEHLRRRARNHFSANKCLSYTGHFPVFPERS
jgi:polynucleotide 5'-hydroxyl-kinase GRC3/NOL9